jgi:ethanolamine utilization protein EutN
MQIGRVIGTVVSTQKHRTLHASKLMLVQPTHPDGTDRGTALLAIDGVGAGIGERVLVVVEGKSAGQVLGQKSATIDAAIVGIIDEIDLFEALP